MARAVCTRPSHLVPLRWSQPANIVRLVIQHGGTLVHEQNTKPSRRHTLRSHLSLQPRQLSMRSWPVFFRSMAVFESSTTSTTTLLRDLLYLFDPACAEIADLGSENKLVMLRIHVHEKFQVWQRIEQMQRSRVVIVVMCKMVCFRPVSVHMGEVTRFTHVPGCAHINNYSKTHHPPALHSLAHSIIRTRTRTSTLSQRMNAQHTHTRRYTHTPKPVTQLRCSAR